MFTSKEKNNNKQPSKFGIVDLKRATQIIQEFIQEPEIQGEERAARNKQVLEDAMAGVPGANMQAQELIASLLEEYGVGVAEMNKSQVAYEIYKYTWGLGPVEDIYHEPDVNELRVNSKDQIYVVRNLKNERLESVSFRDDEQIRNIITRITMHDQGVALNKSCPTIESMRKDGTRITATCPPVTPDDTTFVLRKHSQRLFLPEEMIALGSLDAKTWDILRTLVKCRANILISGGVSSGKTTILQTMVSEMEQKARIIVLGSDNEMRLRKYFPDRDIVELEEHLESGRNLNSLFLIVLRYSPVTIIMEEFRGAGEANEAINACIRGHNGMATAHFTSVKKAIEGTAKLLIKEGSNLELGMAVLDVASAFEIVVQMLGDPIRGRIIVESVTEVVVDQEKIEYRDIIRWVPRGKDYFDGEWVLKGGISPALVEKLCKYAPIDDLKVVGLA
jgi:pilus assembly protein CpaF